MSARTSQGPHQKQAFGLCTEKFFESPPRDQKTLELQYYGLQGKDIFQHIVNFVDPASLEFWPETWSVDPSPTHLISKMMVFKRFNLLNSRRVS